ncbi:hypothetical protein [Staphylococcus pettenkoferi]|uniref:hypothetical protein n=1 Tax=Staphylococcus pettenkoferi TaxID=170573 RepID=UPI0011A06ED2|nr:hypothetical protein [Staphylococcus pettenkoferi]MCY1591288.1 hypothetical protein [Staphylococcus pettenkoferi]MCY1593522.1 hypothetical protein [Staphylococcus pettenkoferi]MCY1598221.1 hypothetical protein [Staphylococcus pettenkoferi]MCY1600487.1 hypothetical protein [Staphylococcus pettenkoferi]MCY1601169.1 hypothetical protein [Staphylococcus pettenkoferi]
MTQTTDTSLKVYIILGWIFAGVALLLLPPIFGIASIVFGALIIAKGRTLHGILMIVTAVICTLIGLIASFVLFASQSGFILF